MPDIESVVRELTRKNPTISFKRLVQKVEKELGIQADREGKQQIGEFYAHERARMNAPRERAIGAVMLIFGGLVAAFGVSLITVEIYGYGIGASVLGLAFAMKGGAGLITGRTSATGFSDGLDESFRD